MLEVLDNLLWQQPKYPCFSTMTINSKEILTAKINLQRSFTRSLFLQGTEICSSRRWNHIIMRKALDRANISGGNGHLWNGEALVPMCSWRFKGMSGMFECMNIKLRLSLTKRIDSEIYKIFIVYFLFYRQGNKFHTLQRSNFDGRILLPVSWRHGTSSAFVQHRFSQDGTQLERRIVAEKFNPRIPEMLWDDIGFYKDRWLRGF